MSIGVVFQPAFPPEQLRSAVEAADSSGVDEVWLWEDCFRESGIATATAALAWTERIRVGVGIMPLPFRNVVVSAVLGRDYPVIQGALLVIAAIYVLINFSIDLLYAVVDPRVNT